MSRILIATDAWHPQVNGVVRTLDTTTRTLRAMGHTVEVLEPSPFFGFATPFYPEIRAALPRPGLIDRKVQQFRPDFVHIATEGPIGWRVRQFCRLRQWRFSTSYHTRFPEYLHTLLGIPASLSYRVLRRFHARSSSLMVATPSLEKELIARGFTAPIRRWTRGVDLSLFCPRPKPAVPWPRPILLSVGRVSAEKGLDAFLSLNTPGTKVIVGDGPALPAMTAKYPNAVFLGFRGGAALAEAYASADLFVFPSRTDTFGIVLIEALASGLPVAAFPVTGPIDIVMRPELGALDEDLGRAIAMALMCGDPAASATEGQAYTWERCTGQFLGNLVAVRRLSDPPMT